MSRNIRQRGFNIFKKIDLFGLPVKVLYQDDWSQKQSVIGALMTVVLVTLALTYVIGEF